MMGVSSCLNKCHDKYDVVEIRDPRTWEVGSCLKKCHDKYNVVEIGMDPRTKERRETAVPERGDGLVS